MARKKHLIVVDEERYLVRKCDPFEQLRLDHMGTKVLGSVFRAAARSSDAIDAVGQMLREVKSAMEDSTKFEAFVEMGVAEFVQQKCIETDQGRRFISTTLSVFGSLSDEIGRELSSDDLVETAKLILVGKTTTRWTSPDTGQVYPERAIDSIEDYAEVIGERLETHGSFHQLRLLGEAVKLNLGPTIAAGLTDLLHHDGGPAAGEAE